MNSSIEGYIVETLDWFDRVRQMLFQQSSVVLRRHGRSVTSHSLPQFFLTDNYRKLAAFEHSMDEAMRVYGKPEATARAESDGVFESTGTLVHWTDSEQHLPRQGWNLPGLAYRITYYEEDSTAIVAFRGTRCWHPGDWYANLHWITRFMPFVNDHYVQVRALTVPLVDFLRTRYGAELAIVTTGHSLGGGLAQQAAYSSPEIRNANAFAPSPVTGFYGVDRWDRERNRKNTLIVRAFEHGEILAYLRFVLRRLVRLSEHDPEVVELRFNCSSLLAISEHSMANMAQYIKPLLAEAVRLREAGAGGQPPQVRRDMVASTIPQHPSGRDDRYKVSDAGVHPFEGS